MAGRKLANSARFLRRPRMACSGRNWRSSLSYFQSPTAPNSTASASFASFSVASGRGWPWRSYATPPTSANSSSNFRSRTFRTLTASSTISVPMPSPGRTAIFISLGGCGLLERVREPGLRRQALRFVLLDLVGLEQREADVVEAVHEAVAAEGLHLEGDLFALRLDDHLAVQVDGQLVAGEGVDFVEQRRDGLLRQHDGQQAVLERVVEEDVGEARGDQRAKAVLLDGPGSVFARGAAAEVAAGEQHGGTLVARLVQHEVRIRPAAGGVLPRLAVIEVAPRVEQVRTEAGLADRLEELLGNDRVGVDVLAVDGGDEALVHDEFVHVWSEGTEHRFARGPSPGP